MASWNILRLSTCKLGGSQVVSGRSLSNSVSRLAGSASGGSSKKKSSEKPTSSAGAGSDINNIKAKDPPNFIFKSVEGPLGPGASKEGKYQNPEYFRYHAFSYTDMDVVMANYRLPQPSSRK